MRRLQLAAGAGHAAGLDGVKAKAAVAIGRHATEAGESSLLWLFALISWLRISAMRIGLPDLHHAVRHRLAVAVEHASLQRDAFAGNPFRRQIVVLQAGEPDMQIRTDRLRSCRLQAHRALSIGVSLRPRRMMSKR